mgnify:CR=1 FL=1
MAEESLKEMLLKVKPGDYDKIMTLLLSSTPKLIEVSDTFS